MPLLRRLEIMDLVRKYKIHQITSVLTDKESEIIKYISDSLCNLTPFDYDSYRYATFYISDNDKIIFIKRSDQTVYIVSDLLNDLFYKYFIQEKEILNIFKYFLNVKNKIDVLEVEGITDVFTDVIDAFKGRKL